MRARGRRSLLAWVSGMLLRLLLPQQRRPSRPGLPPPPHADVQGQAGCSSSPACSQHLGAHRAEKHPRETAALARTQAERQHGRLGTAAGLQAGGLTSPPPPTHRLPLAGHLEPFSQPKGFVSPEICTKACFCFVPKLLCTRSCMLGGGGGGGEIKKKVIGHPNGILKYQTGKTVPVQAQQIPAQLHRSLILLWVGSTRRLSHAEGLRPSSCASRTDTASGLNPSLYYALNPSFFNSVLPEFPSFFSPLNTSFPCTQISTLGSVAFPALERDQFPKPQRQQRTLCFGAGVSPGHSSTALRTLASVQIGSMC